MQAELSALRSEVARLRSADQDRGDEMELLQNRLLVLESAPGTRSGAAAGVAAGRELPVVAIAPDEEPIIEEGPIEGDLPEVHTLSNVARPGQRRPDLRSFGAPAVRRSPPAFAPAPPAGTPGHDSLGVVPVEGLPGGAAAPVAAPSASAYDEGVAHARARRFAEATALLRRFLQESPGHSNAAAAQMLLGECLAGAGRHLEAIGELERLVRRHPGHRAADATLQMGLSYLALEDRERARELLFQVVERHPGTAAARRATERVAQLGETRR